MKGIEMPVNSVIVIALAVMVLLMIAMFFFSGVGQMSASSVESAWTRGCNTLKSAYSCDATQVAKINTDRDVTGDGVNDKLFVVCKMKYGAGPEDPGITEKFCRNKCCYTLVSTSLACGKDIDCTSAIGGGGWKCNTTATNKTCYKS